MGKNSTGEAAYLEPMPFPVLLLKKGDVAEDGTGDNAFSAVYRNPAAESLAAGKEDELISAMMPALCGGVTEWTGEFSGVSLFAHIAPCADGTTLVVLQDRTSQEEKANAANAALRSALDAANAASRAKTEFLSNMSHDIRTPLNAIIGMTTIAQAHMDDKERVADCLEKVELSSRHLLSIINDILDMSRIESGKMTVTAEEFTMADFIHSLMAVFRPQADKKNLRVSLDYTGIRHEHVKGDDVRIQQVLVNILSNAVKFTPEGGTVSLTVRETGRSAKSVHNKNYEYYEFVVADTGIGMSPEFLEKLFMPFERDETVHHIEGTGLGMTITQNLVKMMNGEISVESEKGRGTKFTVLIPLEQLDSGDSELRALRGLRVLGADIDGAARQNLREILEDLGMECDIVGSGWEVNELAARAHTDGNDYFAVILGWRLPVVDGVAICRELREIIGGDIPIILISSYEWTMSGDEMRKHGVSAFVPKPLFRSRLGETLYTFTQEGKNAEQAADGGDDFSGHNVLLVEDNEINREIGVELLEMLGASVECAENGAEALRIFRDSPAGTFDLIFMDIQMPVMNGLTATGAIRALPREDSKTIPIIAMSANAFVEDIRACRRAGMNAHVPKPINIQNLANTMNRFINGHVSQDGTEWYGEADE